MWIHWAQGIETRPEAHQECSKTDSNDQETIYYQKKKNHTNKNQDKNKSEAVILINVVIPSDCRVTFVS